MPPVYCSIRSTISFTLSAELLLCVSGYATVEYRPGDASRPDVHGVMLDLSQEEMQTLANTEAGYDVRDVVVTGTGGKRYAAKTFMSNWSVRLFEETSPTQDYIGKLQEGARIHELPAEYQVGCFILHVDAIRFLLLTLAFLWLQVEPVALGSVVPISSP
jgi:hypothetical protein